MVCSPQLFVPCIDRYDGILLKVEADSMLVIFRNVCKAIDCAAHMQKSVKAYNKDREDTEKISLCIGLGFGRVLHISDEDVFGAEVNAASELGEDTAKAWGILVTSVVRDAALELRHVTFTQIGDIPPGASGAYKMHYTQ
jgi:class 3 adenylate cyclase